MKFTLYIFAGLLLVPLLLAITVWVRSFQVSDELFVDLVSRDGTSWSYARHGLITGRGTLVYYRSGWSAHHAIDPSATQFHLNNYRVIEPLSLFMKSSNQRGRWGFAMLDEIWGEIGARAIVIPFWAVTVVGAVIAMPPFL